MIKINLKISLIAILMLGSTVEIKPLGIIKGAMLVAGTYFGNWYYNARCLYNKIKDLEIACDCSPKNTAQYYEKAEQLNKQINNNLILNGYNSYNSSDKFSLYKILLQCMEKKEQTLANLNDCKEPILKYTSKQKYMQRSPL